MAGLLCWTGWPPMASVPESGATAPVITFIRGDFPAPFSPISAWTSPGNSSNETDFSAWTPAYDLLMSTAWRMGRRSLDMDLLLCASRSGTQPESQKHVEAGRMRAVRRPQFGRNRVCREVGADARLYVAEDPDIACVSGGVRADSMDTLEVKFVLLHKLETARNPVPLRDRPDGLREVGIELIIAPPD